MIQKLIENITNDDIESLVSAKVSERRTLDYKQQLPGASSDERREFLYDICSFANALGGDLVFGIVDERDSSGKPTGLPASVSGVVSTNLSSEIARLENLIRDGIDPRIQAIQSKTVTGFPAGPVLVLRIPRSIVGPHMVVFGGVSKFYSRNATGKYPMDVGEIRSAFAESMALSERLHNYRTGRIERIERGKTPINLVSDPIVAIHLVPLASLGAVFSRDVAREAARFQSLLQPIKGTSWGGRFNFDGFIVESVNQESYIQVFRSGICEAVAVPFASVPPQYKNQIPSIDMERTIIVAIERYLDVQSRLAIPLPLFVAITLLNVRGYKMSSGQHFFQSHAIDRPTLVLPEILVEDYQGDVGKLLRPAFDVLWQACGLEKSLNYDESGAWRPHHS